MHAISKIKLIRPHMVLTPWIIIPPSLLDHLPPSFTIFSMILQGLQWLKVVLSIIEKYPSVVKPQTPSLSIPGNLTLMTLTYYKCCQWLTAAHYALIIFYSCRSKWKLRTYHVSLANHPYVFKTHRWCKICVDPPATLSWNFMLFKYFIYQTYI